MLRKSVVLLGFCLALSLSALAQGPQPQCSVSVAPGSGVAPLTVTATVNCTDSIAPITSVTVNWGDNSAPDNSVVASFAVPHTYTVAGSYVVTVTASDLLGNNSPPANSPPITVTSNQPPTCTLSVSPTSGMVPLTVTATGNCTDPDGDSLTEVLNWGDGTTSAGTSGTHAYPNPGQYTITLTATDSANLSGSASQTVTASNNQTPACSLAVAPTSGTAPLAVTAVATCSDTDGDTLTTVLSWGDGTTTNGTTGAHTYTKAGKYTVTVTATDPAGNHGSASQVVSVSSGITGNSTPTCTLNVSPTSGNAPLAVTAVAACSDTDGDKLTTILSWGDGTSTNGTTGAHTYTKAGKFTVTVTATDPAGNHGSASQVVSVSSGITGNSTPTCTLNVSPTSGNAPLAVSVSANCSDAANDLSSVVTDFGDGFYLNGGGGAHTYVSGGSYTVTVSARDKAGNASSPVSKTITVTDDPVLFLGVGNGQVAQFSRSGNQQAMLNSNQGGSMTGMALDAFENLYTTDFTANTVSKFNGTTLVGTFGTGYNCKPESITFDRAGNAYVGETGCSHAILKFDAYGNLAAAYSVGAQQEGSDWIDLAPDQCTIFYTSQGSSVLRYNACSRQQLPPFATGLNTGLSVKILPDQSVLVADKQDIVRFDSQGRKIMTYDASGENCWVSLALDTDNASFWAADYCSSDVVQFNISSGNEVSKFNSGTPANSLYGLAERVDPPRVAAAGPLLASPAQASISGGQSATFTLNFTPSGSLAGQNFTLSCADLPVNSSCSFSPGTLQAGSGPLSAQLTITTAGASARLAPLRGSHGGWILAMALPWFGMLLVTPGGDPRRHRRRLLLGCLLLVSLLPLLSCSGARNSSTASPASPVSAPTPASSTPAGTYTVVVRATSASGPRSSTAVTLTVQ